MNSHTAATPLQVHRGSWVSTKQRIAIFTAVVVVIAIANVWAWQAGRNDVLDAAYAIPDGGGYCALTDTGVLHPIRHTGSLILSASKGGSYCCGFTFEVAMRVAEQRGLLAKKSVYNVRKFQAEWFGATRGSAEKQCALAVTDLGIGREIDPKDAQPGDFMTLHRTTGIGHSVIFLNWMKDRKGKITGLYYRSSQPDTDGVSENIEYFADSGIGQVERNRLYIARLNRQGWSRLVHPLGAGYALR